MSGGLHCLHAAHLRVYLQCLYWRVHGLQRLHCRLLGLHKLHCVFRVHRYLWMHLYRLFRVHARLYALF
jgi:hypothetical protein